MAQQFEVHPNLVADCRKQLLERAGEALGAAPDAPPAVDVKPLHAKIGRRTLEIDFFFGALVKAKLLSDKR